MCLCVYNVNYITLLTLLLVVILIEWAIGEKSESQSVYMLVLDLLLGIDRHTTRDSVPFSNDNAELSPQLTFSSFCSLSSVRRQTIFNKTLSQTNEHAIVFIVINEFTNRLLTTFSQLFTLACALSLSSPSDHIPLIPHSIVFLVLLISLWFWFRLPIPQFYFV